MGSRDEKTSRSPQDVGDSSKPSSGDSSPIGSIHSSDAEISEVNLERMDRVAAEKAKSQFNPANEAKKLTKQYLVLSREEKGISKK